MMADFKFDALQKEVVIESLQKPGSQVSRKGIRKFVLVGGAVCAIPT